MSLDHYGDFFTALEEAIDRAGSIYKLSRLSGVPLNSISRWRKKDRSPSLESITPLIPFLDWPKRGIMKKMTPNASMEPVDGSDLVRIPVILKAGAGNPMNPWEDEPERFIDVLPRYYTKDVRAVEVCGDSMEPTIKKGSIVGVKPFTGELQEGGIYLVRLPYFGIMIKRVQANGTAGITLISDNQAYQPTQVPYEDCGSLIVGQVVWFWQGL